LIVSSVLKSEVLGSNPVKTTLLTATRAGRTPSSGWQMGPTTTRPRSRASGTRTGQPRPWIHAYVSLISY